MTKKKLNLMKEVKDNIKVGAGVMTGHLVLGSMANIPGMPSQATHTMRTAGSGLNLVATGQMAKTALNLTKVFDSGSKKKVKDKRINKII